MPRTCKKWAATVGVNKSTLTILLTVIDKEQRRALDPLNPDKMIKRLCKMYLTGKRN